MCGRYTLTVSIDTLFEYYELRNSATPLTLPRFNAAPGQHIPAVIFDGEHKRLGTLKWGLIPSWANDPKIAYRLINARQETIKDKPSFRDSFRRRRCLIPADGFYEWKQTNGEKQPVRFIFNDRTIFSMAGLYDTWISPQGERISTCTLITMEASGAIEEVHHRMPLMIRPEDYVRWLERKPLDEHLWSQVIEHNPAIHMTYYAVDAKVGNVRNDDSTCIAPLSVN